MDAIKNGFIASPLQRGRHRKPKERSRELWAPQPRLQGLTFVPYYQNTCIHLHALICLQLLDVEIWMSLQRIITGGIPLCQSCARMVCYYIASMIYKTTALFQLCHQFLNLARRRRWYSSSTSVSNHKYKIFQKKRYCLIILPMNQVLYDLCFFKI